MAKQKQQHKVLKQERKNNSASIERWFPLIIFVFGFAIYFNSIFNDYNMDDELVTQNHRLTSKGISAIPEIFNSPYYADKSGYKYEYRPFVLVSFAIEHSLFGESARVSHFINVLLYSLMCALLFFVLNNILKNFNPLLPFIITLFFTAHPIHTEVVASIKNRDEILALIFGLLSLQCAYQFYSKKNLLHLLLVTVFFLLGILSKSTIITFALLVPLALIMFTQIGIRQILLLTFAFAIPAIFFSRLYSAAQLIVVIAGLFASVFALYNFKNARLSFSELKSLVLKYISISPATDETKISSSLNFSFLKNKLVLFAVFAVILLTTTISVWGILKGSIWLSIVPLSLFMLLYFRIRDELKLIFITPVSLIIICALIIFRNQTGLMEAGLIIFLVYQILLPNKYFKAVGIINYAVYAIVAFAFAHSRLPLAGLIFIGFFNKRFFVLSAVAVIVSLIWSAKHLFGIFNKHKAVSFSLLALPALYAGFALLWKQKRNWFHIAGIFFVPFFLLLSFIFSPRTENYLVTQQVRKNYYALNQTKAPDVTPVQTLRPLSFIEYPLDANTPLDVKSGTAMTVLGKYLQLIFVPYPMSFYYGYAYITPVSLWSFIPLIILLIHVFLFGTAVFFFRKYSLLSFSILFYLLSISVFSNFAIPIPGMIGDRFLLVPSIGFCFFLVVVLAKVFKIDFQDVKLNFAALPNSFKISLTVILVLYSVITFSRNADWKNRITLFRHDITAVANSAQAQNLLGLHLFLQSHSETDAVKQKEMRLEAEAHFKKAIEIYPQFLNASFDLARLYESMQRIDDAYNQYAQTRKIDSAFVAPCFPMAVIQQNKGNLEAAVSLYEKYLTKYPRQYEVYANMSFAYFQLNKFDSSIAVNKRALLHVESKFEPNVNIAKTFLRINERDSAVYYLRQAQRINPNDVGMINLLRKIEN